MEHGGMPEEIEIGRKGMIRFWGEIMALGQFVPSTVEPEQLLF
jgi:hypothetical protein